MPRASDHRHRGAKAALQLAGQGMGAGHGHIAELFCEPNSAIIQSVVMIHMLKALVC